ncbi:MAG: hypothetical protein GF317_21805 [Candidatus Lokiarchaeota archaeon]|nr:hypothetical protein [Candidatus Lokiarchaeota archaeon]MBD3202097.1 hypothetical protein [Candidatus Lokiarchaeota archaeon]
MRKKTKLTVICSLFASLFIVNSLMILSNQSGFSAVNKLGDGMNQSQNPTQDDSLGGYSKNNVGYFDILEKARSIIKSRDYKVDSSKYYNISTPLNWTTEYKKFEFDSYHKNQTIEDSQFTQSASSSPWSKVKLDLLGGGSITQSFEPNNLNPKNVLTHLEHSSSAIVQPGFNAWKEFGFWNQTLSNLNPNNLQIQEGELYQRKNEEILASDFIEDPDFNKDVESPYGGEYKTNDDITMDWEEDYLYINILPASGLFGGNPSAAWWSYLELPYQVDYAEVKISWSIDDLSTFEAEDDYQVSARINNRYIDGRDWIEKDDSIPLNGSKTALMVYNDSSYERHDYITRTYDVTRLINQTIGINKFDFGIWAKNPTGGGDIDQAIVNFDSIEIKYNITDKYEIAQLDFEYLLVDNINGDDTVDVDDPNSIINDASIFLVLNNDTTQKRIKVLPFNSVNKTGSKSDPFNHIRFSIPQDYREILNSDELEFYLGVIFEKDIYNDMDYELYFDNVTFTINYKHPNTQFSGLQINVDDSISGWQSVNDNEIIINTTSWKSGENHTFRYRTINNSFSEKLYINIKSILKLNISRLNSDGAYSNYEIDTENEEFGLFNIIYNNSFSYSKIDSLNSTQFFNLSSYNINYIKFPSFDNQSFNSDNWNIIGAYSPSIINFTSKIDRYAYESDPLFQNVRINSAFERGNWVIRATEPNYIVSGTFNNSDSYLGKPLLLRNSTFSYNYSLNNDKFQNYTGYYTITIVNTTGSAIASFPKYYTSSYDSNYLTGEIFIPSAISPNLYYFSIRWNDTSDLNQETLRFGSNIKSIFIINATIARFNVDNLTVQPGEIANYSLYYRVKYTNWGINTTNLFVLENSTGSFVRWGRTWSGQNQYTIEYKGDGNYTIHIDTTGAPNGNYTLKFIIYKLYNQPQNLTSNLEIASENLLFVEITQGAYHVAADHYHISNNNIPYVNDTINSVIQINLTDSGGVSAENARITGKIGEYGVFTQAIEIYDLIPIEEYKGLYNLTLDTTGLNATNLNKTLHVSCSATGFKLKTFTVNLTIKKIPTNLNLQNIDDSFEEGEISVQASIYNLINPEIPKPNNHATLTYYIFQGTTTYKTGLLEYVLNGVYTKEISISGLIAGNYTVYIEATAFNCENSTSNYVNFSVLPQESTNIDIFIPDVIRILKPFDIRAKLSYSNGTVLANEIVSLNITRIDKNSAQMDSLIISDSTNAEGNIFYNDYIIPEDFKGGQLIINASYNGLNNKKSSEDGIQSIISGKIPIFLTIVEHPNNTAKVGYSATYKVKINISDTGEILKNRIILFNAYYENNIDNPFVSTQLSTDSNGETSYTIEQIANNYENMTVYFEYLGSSTVAYNFTTRKDLILPKWTSNFTYKSLPDPIRHGQAIVFNMTFWCPENTSLSFTGLSVTFKFEYGGTTELYTQFISENNTIVFHYTVADLFDNQLNITISLIGNTKIDGEIEELNLNILDKLPVLITFIQNPSSQYFQGTQFISVRVSDNLSNYLTDFDIVFELYNGDILVNTETAKTNDEGIASTSLDFSQIGDNFIIKISFAKSGIYESSELTSSRIRVVNEFIIFLDYLPYILIAVGIVAGISLIAYRGVVVPRRRKRQEALKKIYQRLSDIENIQYILILTKEGGVPVFSKSLADVPIDESLVSGFLSAISSFGEEIGYKMKKQKGGLEELSYRQFKITMDEGQYIRTALLLLKRPSDSIKIKLTEFNKSFEASFKSRLVKYTGEVIPEAGIMRIVEDIFEADLLYPHQIVENKAKEYLKSTSRGDLGKKILIVAKDDEFESSFYLRDMINHLKTKGIDELRSFEALEKLKKDDVVFAINPRTNYLIDQLQPVIQSLNRDDRHLLFASLEGIYDMKSLEKFLKKKNYTISSSIQNILKKLYKLELLDSEGRLTETGTAIATLLKLIPDL